MKTYISLPVEVRARSYQHKEDAKKFKRLYGDLIDIQSSGRVFIHTLNGLVRLNHGDWLIESNGEIYPCNALAFSKKYQRK